MSVGSKLDDAMTASKMVNNEGIKRTIRSEHNRVSSKQNEDFRHTKKKRENETEG